MARPLVHTSALIAQKSTRRTANRCTGEELPPPPAEIFTLAAAVVAKRAAAGGASLEEVQAIVTRGAAQAARLALAAR